MNLKKIKTYSAHLLLAIICGPSTLHANWFSDFIDVMGCAFTKDCPQSSQQVHNLQNSLVNCRNLTPEGKALADQAMIDQEKALHMKGSPRSGALDKTEADIQAFTKEINRINAVMNSLSRSNIIVKGEICTGSHDNLPIGCLHDIHNPQSCGSEALNNACLVTTHDNSLPEQLTPTSCSLVDPSQKITLMGGVITCLMTPENKAELQKIVDANNTFLAEDIAKLATNSATYTPAQHAQIRSAIDKLAQSIAASKMDRALPYPQGCAWDTEDARIAQSTRALNACLITTPDKGRKPLQLKPLTCTANSADL